MSDIFELPEGAKQPKRCPFCGAAHFGVTGIFIHNQEPSEIEGQHGLFVSCDGCQADGPWQMYVENPSVEDINEAIDACNRRY